MKVNVYEKIFMWAVALGLASFFVTTAVAAVGSSIQPPSHIETIDPTKVLSDPRFTPQGVRIDRAGHVHAHIVGLTFAWLPAEMTIPAGKPVTFHVTSTDVQHGFQIVRTNGQAQVLPGYISQFTTELDAGDYLIVCNEYCGVGHHTMAAKLHVVPAQQWKAP